MLFSMPLVIIMLTDLSMHPKHCITMRAHEQKHAVVLPITNVQSTRIHLHSKTLTKLTTPFF